MMGVDPLKMMMAQNNGLLEDRSSEYDSIIEVFEGSGQSV